MDPDPRPLKSTSVGRTVPYVRTTTRTQSNWPVNIYFVRIVSPCGLIEKRLVPCAEHKSTQNLHCGKTDQPASTSSGTDLFFLTAVIKQIHIG